MPTSETSGKIEPLAQEIDSDEHVEEPAPQIAQDRDPLERFDLAVQIANLQPVLEQEVGQVLGHFLGQRRDQDALAALGPLADLFHKSSTWLRVGRTSTSGSTRPVGRMIISATCVDFPSSYVAGVALT